METGRRGRRPLQDNIQPYHDLFQHSKDFAIKSTVKTFGNGNLMTTLSETVKIMKNTSNTSTKTPRVGIMMNCMPENSCQLLHYYPNPPIYIEKSVDVCYTVTVMCGSILQTHRRQSQIKRRCQNEKENCNINGDNEYVISAIYSSVDCRVGGNVHR